MKFGETLQQRSIPQWAHHNVDYNELKHLIKEKTSNLNTSPVSIPGQGGRGNAWEELENELFSELYHQHLRVNTFTRSKYGEIERRLNHVVKQIQQLGRESRRSQSRGPVQQSRKFRKLVEEAEGISEDIQSLSRYTNTQRLAFKKILKKYTKWTGSSRLTIRMNNEVFHHPTSFSQPDFTPLLGKLSDLQTVLRRISLNGIDKSAHSPFAATGPIAPRTTDEDTASKKIDDAFQSDNSAAIDAALASTPLGRNGGIAVYWVHPDNVAEVRVLLLRHMKDRGASSPSLSRTSSVSSMGSRHGSISREMAGSTSDNTYFLLFDDLKDFVHAQNAATLNETEQFPGSCASRVAMQALWNKNSKSASVMTRCDDVYPSNSRDRSEPPHPYEIHQLKVKDLTKLRPTAADTQSKELYDVQFWMEQHPKIRPLAQITSRRTRFEGLDNSDISGIWATLDQVVTLSSPNDVLQLEQDTSKQIRADFPHAVLALRWEGYPVPEIINMLNSSYLVERVRGFSLQLHAVYTICAPSDATKPLWMSIIDKDIRKVPPKQPRPSRSADIVQESSKTTSASAPSTDGSSGIGGLLDNVVQSSATSVDNMVPDSPKPTSSSSRKIKPQRRRPSARKPREPVQRYWNEFDDGSDGEDRDVYTIYVDPNASFEFPGTEIFSKVTQAVAKAVKTGAHQVLHWFSQDKDTREDGSREPLLGRRTSETSNDGEDSSDSEENLVSVTSPPSRRKAVSKRRTLSSTVQLRRRRSRETGLLRTYVGCFVAAFILLFITSILEAAGRRKAVVEVDLGVVIGVVASLCFSIMGISLMLVRKDKLSWLHRIAVFLAFAIVCVVSGILLAMIANAI